MYSEKVRRLISDLPNRGILPEASHSARVENPVCGDVTHLYLKIEGGIVNDCRFQCYGCPGAMAAAAAITQLCKSKHLSECLRLDVDTVIQYLGGLPSHKRHGAELAVEALRAAIGNRTDC